MKTPPGRLCDALHVAGGLAPPLPSIMWRPGTLGLEVDTVRTPSDRQTALTTGSVVAV